MGHTISHTICNIVYNIVQYEFTSAHFGFGLTWGRSQQMVLGIVQS